MDDLISRQAAIDAIERNSCNTQRAIDAVNALPSAQPEILACGEGELNVPDTNVGDMIHRQAAIDAALTYLVEYCGAAFDEDMQRMLKERLDSLPSAQPGWSEQYKNKQTNCKKMPLPEPWKGEEHGTSRAVLSQKPVR